MAREQRKALRDVAAEAKTPLLFVRLTAPQDVVVLGDGCWRRRFGADPGVVGRQITVNGRPFTVVGVMPPALEAFAGETGMWRPLSLPNASGRIIWLRNSSRAPVSIRMAGAASSGAKSGQKANAAAPSPSMVPKPRNQRALPMFSARSGAQSSAAIR